MGALLPVVLLFGMVASLPACNTTKATADSIVKFSSSTSPESLFTGDGAVLKEQQVMLYTAVVADALQEDIAGGRGEYLASLRVLLDIPAERQAQFNTVAQEHYASVFPAQGDDRRKTLAVLRQQIARSRAEVLR